MSKEKYEYASAPYNFIPLPEKVVYRHCVPIEKINISDEVKRKYGIDELPAHNNFDKKLKTGYIDYTITTKTPLFISNGKEEFFNINGEYVIPGATVRGKVRSNAEILSWSNPEFIKDSRLWYRGAFSADVLKILYKKFLFKKPDSTINDKVKAGYLVKRDGEFRIIPAEEDDKKSSFKEIHERYFRRCKDIDYNIRKGIFMYNYTFIDTETGEKNFLWDRVLILKGKKKDLLKNSKKINDENEIKKLIRQANFIQNDINNFLNNNRNRNFKPYYYKAYYSKVEDSVKVSKVVENSEDLECGFIMNSVNSNAKQHHYLIYKKSYENHEGKVINRELINQYKTSVKYRQEGEFENFSIDENKDKDQKYREKPIFYILNDDGEIISFGFTPYLKIPYEKSVWDGIYTKREYENKLLDYAQSIFGFTNFLYEEDKNSKQISYKGRVSFTNARLIENKDKIFENEIYKSLMGPKISSFQLYLEQDKIEDYNLKESGLSGKDYDKNLNKYKNSLKTYSGDFKLRGYKFYWLKDECNKNDDYEKAKCENNRKWTPSQRQFSRLKAISSGKKFKGRVYFENLTEDELGLLIMSIKPFDGAMDNLGQGKPYGFGKVDFGIDEVSEINTETMFKEFNSRKKDYSKLTNEKVENYKDSFRKFIEKQHIKFDFSENIRLKCFYVSKSKEQNLEDREFCYMDLKDKSRRFINRNILKSTEDYVSIYYKNEIDDEKLGEILKSKFNVSRRKEH